METNQINELLKEIMKHLDIIEQECKAIRSEIIIIK